MNAPFRDIGFLVTTAPRSLAAGDVKQCLKRKDFVFCPGIREYCKPAQAGRLCARRRAFFRAFFRIQAGRDLISIFAIGKGLCPGALKKI
jgi:hypothetical protein